MDISFPFDEIGFGGLKMYQDPQGFKYGTDAVLLADFAASFMDATKEEILFDLGTGTGIIPLILSAKTGNKTIYGLEVQPGASELAEANVRINGLEDRIHILTGNVKDIDSCDLPEATILKGRVDIVTSNPPYTEEGRGILSGNAAKDIARHEIEGTLADFIAAAEVLLRDEGSLFMVHRPGRLADILVEAVSRKLAPRHIKFVNGKSGEAPNIVLIHCIKNGGKNLDILPTLTVRDESGKFTEEMLAAYEI